MCNHTRKLTPEQRQKKNARLRAYSKTPAGKAARRRYRNSPQGVAQERKRSREERRASAIRQRARIKLQALREYSGGDPKCSCCGESNIGFLSLDHVNNDGAAHRRALGLNTSVKRGGLFYFSLKKLGWPKTPPLQVLCYNCNFGRHYNGGICPHHGMVGLDKSRMAKPIVADGIVREEVANENTEYDLFDNPPIGVPLTDSLTNESS